MKPKQILTDKEKLLIQYLYEIGKTDQEVADVLHTPRQTLHEILRYNDLLGTIKKGIADSKVEISLYHDALTPGNTTAKIFWLCNRQKGRWQNVNKVEHAGPNGESLNIVMVRSNGNDKKNGK